MKPIDSRSKPAFHLGLTGYPLDGSFSPQIHCAGLRACGLDGDFALFPVAPEDSRGLDALLARLRSGEVAGLGVTMPHKELLIPVLDVLSPEAQRIGAVNALCLQDGQLTGFNTDAQGFMADLRRSFAGLPNGQQGAGSSEKTALVLGAGGSARAVVYALLSDGWCVTIAARRHDQADEIGRSLQHANSRPPTVGLRIVDFELSDFHASGVSLIVNATPLGMAPRTGACPWPEGRPFPAHAAVYDLVYNPRETRLVRRAREAGLEAATGIGMLVEQAALAFELWTGESAPREAMFAAVGLRGP